MTVETMKEVEVIVPCPSCARPMASISDNWQCLACHPIPEDIPICATFKCKKPLTKLGEPWNCWICLRCNEHPEVVNKKMKQKQIDQQERKYVKDSVPYSEFEKLQKQVAELMQKPDYPPARAEINEIAESVKENAEPVIEVAPKPETYLQRAKRLGVQTHYPDGGGMRKKADVLAGIAAKEGEGVSEFIKAAQSPPSDDDEFARGLTAEDMI